MQVLLHVETGLMPHQQSRKYHAKPATSSAACLLEECNCLYQVGLCKGEAFCFLPLGMRTGLPVHINANFAVINNRRGIWTNDSSASPIAPEAKWNEQLMSTTIPEAYCSLIEALKDLQLHKKLRDYTFCKLWPVKDNLEQQNPWSVFVVTLFKMLASRALFYSDAVNRWLTLENSTFLAPNIISVNSTELTIDTSASYGVSTESTCC